jgi:hypothetical protein
MRQRREGLGRVRAPAGAAAADLAPMAPGSLLRTAAAARLERRGFAVIRPGLQGRRRPSAVPRRAG